MQYVNKSKILYRGDDVRIEIGNKAIFKKENFIFNVIIGKEYEILEYSEKFGCIVIEDEKGRKVDVRITFVEIK